ncbi:MAG: very short patch repair endonuclease [Patescibacteria group bacterium]|nr:MAG: very short patch repair endonuclease [Patescibacteria group bacterium]
MDNLTKEQRRICMSRIRSKDTKPEKIVKKILTQFGLRYRLHNAKLPGKPDIVISKMKTIFFINGCFWHQHKGCKKQAVPKANIEYWGAKLKRSIEKQKKDIKLLRKAAGKCI